jgi:chromosome condensin MukBEF complex kleisin-like MukF subunit
MPAIGNIDELVETRATVSDHAVLRYLERAYGLDVAAVRAEMMTAIPIAIAFGARTVICHGVRLIISEDGCVVTALPRRKR